MGGGNPPKGDPNIGLAAMKSADLGEDYLAWAKARAKTTDRWAAQDRHRSQTVFQPLQDSYIKSAKTWDSAGRQNIASREAVGDVALQGRLGQQQQARQLAAMGVNPNSRRFVAGKRGFTLDLALAKAGASNLARRDVRSTAQSMRANAINMGSGLAVNPATSFGMGSSAVGNGFQGAMSGYNQQGQLLNSQFQNEMQGYQASQEGQGALFGSLGMAAGMMVDPTKLAMLPLLSDEKEKKGRKPARSALAAFKKMSVDEWEYKDDAPASPESKVGRHVGPMAQDWKAATGLGDGRSIAPVDAIGMTMQAIKEIDKKVDRIARSVKRPEPERMAA